MRGKMELQWRKYTTLCNPHYAPDNLNFKPPAALYDFRPYLGRAGGHAQSRTVEPRNARKRPYHA